MEPLLTPKESRDVAEALFAVDWQDAEKGWMKCPGLARHTKPDGPRDCNIMLAGGKPPTIHCLHGSCISEIAAANFSLRSALGKAEFTKKKDGKAWVPAQDWRPDPPRETPAPPEYDAEKLKQFAGEFAGSIDAAWLANRSPVDPSICTTDDFLHALYHADRGEKVLIFTNEYSQGEYMWPCADLPVSGKEGVFFLAQPVSGEYLPNPRSRPPGQPSRRIMECVRTWRYMLLESDSAPARLWLAAVVQLPLRIAAIYTSGSRSVHVLVQVDAPTRDAWDGIKAQLLNGLVTLGACRGSLSSVRLSRLPGCLRLGKKKPLKDDAGNAVLDEKERPRSVYEKFSAPGLQKLLYLAPEPDARPLASLVARRDVLEQVKSRAVEISRSLKKMSLEELQKFAARALHFASISEECANLAAEVSEMIVIMRKKTK